MKEGVKKYIRKMMTGIMIPVLFMLSGCSEGDMDPLVPARDVSFGNHEKTTVEVLKGNIKPVFEKEITLSGYEESNFRIEQRIMDEYTREYNMKLDGVNVSVGDIVRKGDTLLSFRSDVLEKKRKEWQSAKTSDSLQMEHYKNLMNIDSSYDYTEDCYDLTNDIALANLYIQDIDEIYSAINLISDRDGVVSYVEQSVKDGFLSVGPDIITVSSDDGYYVMDLSSGTDEEAGGEMVDSSSIEFKVGDTFKAKSYMNEYELEVIADPALSTVDDSEDGDELTSPGDAVSGSKVYFKLINDATIKEQSLVVYKELPELKNVCYVDKKAIIRNENETYVYKKISEGNYMAVKVTPGEQIGQYVVIKEGLEEGDVVSISE